MSKAAAAVQAVCQGELVVIPTDTVYGIGANPFDSGSVAKLLQAKGRGEQMPPPVLVSDLEQARTVGLVPAWVEKFWPGPLTVVVPTVTKLGWDKDTVALRVPADEATLSLLTQTGPLAVTSANKTGEPPAKTVSEAWQYFGRTVAVYIDGGTSPLGKASTIADLTDGRPRLLRNGALDWDEVECAYISY